MYAKSEGFVLLVCAGLSELCMREVKAMCCVYVQAHLDFMYAKSEGFVLQVCAGLSELCV